MKSKFFLPLLCIALIFSCTKNNNNPVDPEIPKYKLKAIFYPINSAIPLCGNCPPIITQESEYFNYDSDSRLVSRIVIGTTLSDNPVTVDTFAIYSYSYSDN